ncbi:hypothetical protein D3C72_1874920 [compost metagenome]
MAHAGLDDLGLAHVLQRRLDTETLAFDPGLGRQVGHAFEGRNELGTAIRVAGIVHRIDPDEDIARTQHLGPAQGQGQEHGIARRHIGDRNAFGGAFRHRDAAVGQRRTADAIEVQADHLVLDHPQVPGHPLGRLQFGAMALAIVEAHAVTAVALGLGQRHHGGRIEATREKN